MMLMRDAELYPFIDADWVMVPAALQDIRDALHVPLFRELLDSLHPPEQLARWRATVANFAKIIPPKPQPSQRLPEEAPPK